MFEDQADRILQKAIKNGKCAVFVVDGALKTTAFETKGYDMAIKNMLSRLLGVYDGDCPIDWITSDLLWAEKHFIG